MRQVDIEYRKCSTIAETGSRAQTRLFASLADSTMRFQPDRELGQWVSMYGIFRYRLVGGYRAVVGDAAVIVMVLHEKSSHDFETVLSLDSQLHWRF